MQIRKLGFLFIAILVLAAGCSSAVVRNHAIPSRAKDQYTRVKRIAVFPLENYSDTKDAEKTVDSLVTTAIREENTFELVEDTRFVRDTMKKLKITSTDILEKEVVKKLGDEMNVQGVLYGKVLTYGKGKDKDAGSQVTIDLALVEPSTGIDLWVGNTTVYGGLTVGKVFGVSEGMTDIEVARKAVRGLVRSMSNEVDYARNKEKKGIIADLKRDVDLERAKLESLKGETGKVQGEITKARSEAKGITEAASKEAEKLKSDLDVQKAALEAEKSKTQAAQQEIDQEKLKVEVERKKVAEDLKRIEDEKKALDEARRKAEEAKKKPEEIPGKAPEAPTGTPAAPAPVNAPEAPTGTPAAPAPGNPAEAPSGLPPAPVPPVPAAAPPPPPAPAAQPPAEAPKP